MACRASTAVGGLANLGAVRIVHNGFNSRRHIRHDRSYGARPTHFQGPLTDAGAVKVEPTIGLELHVQLASQSKLFSSGASFECCLFMNLRLWARILIVTFFLGPQRAGLLGTSKVTPM